MTHQYKKLPVTMKMRMQFNVMPWTSHQPQRLMHQNVFQRVFPIVLCIDFLSHSYEALALAGEKLFLPHESILLCLVYPFNQTSEWHG